MKDDLTQLVHDVSSTLAVEPPRLLADDSAALQPGTSSGDAPPYLVGLIGGKDVGKTSLANAIAGTQLTAPIGHGRGTQRAIAFVHERAEAHVEPLLRQEAGEALLVVPHRHDPLLRQVLVDLPDIDSKYADHVALTRRMLRHMLFPVWVQSVEKYADAAPQQLLKQVAEGNDPANFLFVLNKADQVIDREGEAAAQELAADYAARLQRLLELPTPPRIFLVAANQPDALDLPKLRAALAQQKSGGDVKQARQLALARRQASLASWVKQQNVPAVAARVGRVRDAAADAVAAELAGPLIEEAVQATLGDATTRSKLVEPTVARKVRQWPVVNLLDVAAAPVIALVRKNLAETPGGTTPDAHLAATGRPVAARVRGVFAELHAQHDEVGDLYVNRRLWQETEAAAAAGSLRHALGKAFDAQRRGVGTLPRRRWLAPWRWLLTFGAVVWFPLIQPVAEVFLTLLPGGGIEADLTDIAGWRDLALTAVSVLSAQHLLDSALFLLIWFVVLWAYLRWAATQKAKHQLGTGHDGLVTAAANWCDDLLAPLEQRAAALGQLAQRAEKMRKAVAAG
jgi:hypothetical protein